ncbi:MAG: amino acid permease, partial [Erysipelotrichaceae bacterium]|nr:amino acid permease [Erysipelotrichaceae bacterium]
LQKSGLLGTVFGLLLGMCVIMVITWNLQYMIRKEPDAGGIYSFEIKIGNKDMGFLALWFVLLTYLAVFWANITSVPLFARFFLGETYHFGFHYQIFGYEVWFGEALLSICSVLLIGLLCSRNTRLTDRIMSVASVLFATGFTVCALIAIFRHDSSFSYSPLYIEGSEAFGQIVRIAAISPWAFIGFENISHFSEEYAFPIKKIRGILITSVIFTTVLYLFVSVLSVSAYPPEYSSWIAYISDMGNLSGLKAVPAFYAAEYYLGQTGVSILMLSLFAVILTSLIGNMLALSRLLYAAGRNGEAPEQLTKLNDRGIPVNAIYAIVGISVLIPFLGRTAIGWIVDVTTLGATLIYGMISYAVFVYAKRHNDKTEQYSGIIGVILMIIFLLLLLIPGLLPFQAMETESYALFIVWAVLGLGYFRYLVNKDSKREYGQHIIVWLILLVLVLFASMMWVSRATENAANTAVQNIFEYHQNHPDHDAGQEDVEHRVEFLQQQAEQISRTNILYTGVSLALFGLCIAILLNNYRHTQKLGQQLTIAEDTARAAQKIAELKESITSLLDNMPSMSFSKDAKTGVYLACNQAFADYANKPSPEYVVGLTDEEIFDPVTAKHFTDDDHMALSMDKAYVFFEDVLDPLGNQKHFRTTKLKYIDASGKLCLLGMCEDITDMIRMKLENATTKEAYENARNSSLIYTRIAQTLARGYTDLYYVNLDNEEFIEYLTSDDSGLLSEARRGTDFFEELKIEAQQFVHADDRDSFIKTMDRENLLNALSRNKTFIMTYRIINDNEPMYVMMKVSRMDEEDNFIIIGVTDVDEQTKHQKAAERMEEEHTAYARLNALIGDFLCVYVVVPETGRYREYSSSSGFAQFDLPKEGFDFYKETLENCKTAVYKEDLERFLSLFSKEGILSEIERNGIFSMTYRLVMDQKPVYVQLRAAMVH